MRNATFAQGVDQQVVDVHSGSVILERNKPWVSATTQTNYIFRPIKGTKVLTIAILNQAPASIVSFNMTLSGAEDSSKTSFSGVSNWWSQTPPTSYSVQGTCGSMNGVSAPAAGLSFCNIWIGNAPLVTLSFSYSSGAISTDTFDLTVLFSSQDQFSDYKALNATAPNLATTGITPPEAPTWIAAWNGSTKQGIIDCGAQTPITPVTITTAATTALLGAQVGKTWHICEVEISVAAAQTVQLEMGGSGNCTFPTLISPVYNMAANTTLILGGVLGEWRRANSNSQVCAITTTTGGTSIQVSAILSSSF